MSSFSDRVASLQKVRRVLRKEQGKPSYEVADDVALQLLRFVLLEDSSQAEVEAALKKLNQGFVDLNELRISFPPEVVEVIPDLPHVAEKASKLIRLYNAMFHRQNTMTWDFVRTMGVRELRNYFERIDGGDPVLASAVILFFSQGHAIPADADVRRVMGRLGVTEEGESLADLHSFLERAVPKEQGLETWLLLHRHGETLCLPGEPLCQKCPLLSACPFGKDKMSQKKAPRSKKGAADEPPAKSPVAAESGRKGQAGKPSAKSAARESGRAAQPSAKSSGKKDAAAKSKKQ